MKSASLLSVFPLGASLKLSFNTKSLTVVLFGILVSLFAISILQVNAYTRELYLLQDYEARISQLTEENRYLEINFTKANSLNNIGDFVQNMIFEKADKIEYIKVLETTALAK